MQPCWTLLKFSQAEFYHPLSQAAHLFRSGPGLLQVPVLRVDILKTAVSTPLGLFEFLSMPFGHLATSCTPPKLRSTVAVVPAQGDDDRDAILTEAVWRSEVSVVMAIQCSSLLLGIVCLFSVQLAGAETTVPYDAELPLTVGTVEKTLSAANKVGWTQYGQREFMFFAIGKTWEEAESTCVQNNANLASVHSENEDAFIKRLIWTQAGRDHPTWLGGYNSHMVPQRWFWTDESAFDFAPWTQGQPDGSGHCLQTNFRGGWDDLVCNQKIPFVCARLIRRGAETTVPYDAELPLTVGTVEKTLSAANKVGWTQYGQREFMFFAIGKTWEEAESTCVQNNANLASVHSENEDAFIKRLIWTQAGRDHPTWLGGYNSHMVPQRWFWTDESAFDFAPWTQGQPDGSGHCLQTNFRGGWDDLVCNQKIPFVCARLIRRGV
ncbi:hypothetical protein AOLI_G00273750 [Acnodon oligacanthus]